MKFSWRWSIRKQLSLLILSLTLVTGLLGYGAFLIYDLHKQQVELEHQASLIAHVLSENFARALLQDDIQVISDIHRSLNNFDLLKSAIIFNRQGQPAFQFSRDNEVVNPDELSLSNNRLLYWDDKQINIYQPLNYGASHIGDAWFSFELQGMLDRLKNDLPIIMLIAICMLLVSYALSNLVASSFTTPIFNLINFFETTEKLDGIKDRPSWKKKNEFGRLYDEINLMLNRIEEDHENLKIAAVAFETETGMVVTDAQQRILQVNRAFTRITGYSKEEAKGGSPKLLQSGRHPISFYQTMWDSLQSRKYWEGEIWNRNKSGDVYPERLTIQAILNDHGETAYYVGSFIDLSDLKKAEAKVEYLGLYDPLTGLANRKLFINQVQIVIQSQCNNENPSYAAIYCFDLDNLRLINESFGHALGDLLLVEVSQRLKQFFGERGFIARLDSDLFAVLQITNVLSFDEATLAVEQYAEQMLKKINNHYQLDDKQVVTFAKAGLSLFKSPAQTAQEVLHQAESALYQVKQSLDSRIGFFDPAAENLARDYLEIQEAMVNSLADGHFELYYQVQCDSNASVLGAEALLRWNHPEKGLIPPDQFIPTAERSRLILPLGAWVLRQACMQLALWQQNKKTGSWTVAVNVSALQFQQGDFIDQVLHCIRSSGIDPKGLKLELTEALMISDFEVTVQKMRRLNEVGVQISLDDFGTGYSSLRYLRDLPIDQIKIDRAFVRNLENSASDVAIIEVIIGLGKVFNMEIIAEGVETKEQLEILVKLGCNNYQGYLFGRPMSVLEWNQVHEL